MKFFLTLILTTLSFHGCTQENTSQLTPATENQTQNSGSEASTSTLSDVEMVVPDQEAPLLGGGTLNLAEMEGKVLVVNFWATWCGPCRVEMPDLIALHEEYGDETFSVIGIATDIEGEEIVGPFVEEMGISFPTILDDGTLSEAFGGVYVLPTTFVVDKKGNVRHRTIGLFPVNQSRENLESMMAAG